MVHWPHGTASSWGNRSILDGILSLKKCMGTEQIYMYIYICNLKLFNNRFWSRIESFLENGSTSILGYFQIWMVNVFLWNLKKVQNHQWLSAVFTQCWNHTVGQYRSIPSKCDPNACSFVAKKKHIHLLVRLLVFTGCVLLKYVYIYIHTYFLDCDDFPKMTRCITWCRPWKTEFFYTHIKYTYINMHIYI